MEDMTYGEAMIRRLRNLKMFKGKSDEEIRQYLASREPNPQKLAFEGELSEQKSVATKEAPPPETPEDVRYERKFRSKLKTLQTEYSIDMNDANDADALRSLVRLALQLEAVDQQIRDLQTNVKNLDSRTLKNLGDYQRSVQTSITELQDRLGIARKQRKEKQVDDIPKYIADLQQKVKDFWEGKTVAVRCEKDQIELLRFWINFPKLENEGTFKLTCWKCKEIIVYSL